MGFNKIVMGRDYIFNVEIIDQDGKRIENFKVMKKDFPVLCHLLTRKYDIAMNIKFIKTEKKDDLDWAIK